MKLQTTIPLQNAGHQIDYGSKLLLLGSCFVENIGGKLNYYKFQQLQNPLGILFHPLAIENLVERSLANRFFSESEVFERDGIWQCFEAHSDLRANSSKELVKMLNESLAKTKNAIENASHVFITLGTSWVYHHKGLDKVVANCHKVPQKEFSKELVSAAVIKKSLEKVVAMVQGVNPNAQLVFTISPVRHLKDGFVENQRSKANLITAVHEFREELAVSYFPAYEIVMDELRDYRFYKNDMVHPNELAVDYIWEKFKAVWISSDCLAIMDEVEAIQKGLQHRPFNADSEAHQKFKESLAAKIAYLQERYPFMKFE
ncbi:MULTISPECIES: GSCFA domain-containing protein [Flavobacteriaceae]|uniref:GSCFA domain-containing protein n=1 Tax=Flavobacteriaceae TaxID=49546 RepID=UPI0014918A78|nr:MULTISPECIES: GSCFA domain-containing protein [Allomuricauda]MDC6365681.1 GSCFA domain-containing protein [Muricauda sp. AC10]